MAGDWGRNRQVSPDPTPAKVNAPYHRQKPTRLAPSLSKTYLGRSPGLYEEFAPPPETEILTLPEHLAPRPLHAHEARMPWWTFREKF